MPFIRTTLSGSGDLNYFDRAMQFAVFDLLVELPFNLLLTEVYLPQRPNWTHSVISRLRLRSLCYLSGARYGGLTGNWR